MTILQQKAFDGLCKRAEQLPHALLLHGPQGIGKLELAEHFAQWLLCEARGSALAPCGGCAACRWFQAGSHPDFRRIEPEARAERSSDDSAEQQRGERGSDEIKIGQIRELADFLYVGSHRGARRVAVVVPAEEMNSHAANALLKGLEEPPAGVVFILVAHRPARLLPTVVSRCVPVALVPPEPGEARAWLARHNLADADRWLAFAGGAPLRALEYGQGEIAEPLGRMLGALSQGDLDALEASASSRAELPLLVDVLQRFALDRALAATGAAPVRFGTVAPPRTGGSALAWLNLAREMGRQRRMARHPLNAALFSWEVCRRVGACLKA